MEKNKQVIFAVAFFQSPVQQVWVLWEPSPAPEHCLCNRTGREILLLIAPALLGSEPAGDKDGSRKDIPRFLKASKICSARGAAVMVSLDAVPTSVSEM